MRVVAPPTATVKGAAGDQVNSVLVPAHRAMALTVSGALPPFDDLDGEAWDAPTVTPPRSRLGGARARCGVGAATPLPVSVTGMVAWSGSFEATVRAPASVPTLVGA